MSNTAYTLENCMIVTVDSKGSFFPNGKIIIDEGAIVYVGDMTGRKSIGRVFDMERRIVMPGLVNTHTHSPSSMFRGYADDFPLRIWLEEHMWPAERQLTAEFALCASRLSYLEYLTHGMTTNVDMWYFADQIYAAALESGLRSFIAAGIFSFPSPESDDSLEVARSFVESHATKPTHDTRVVAALGPHDAYSCSPEILSEVAQIAGRSEAITTIHLSEASGDNEEIMAKYGLSPTRYLQTSGLFENRVIAAHCIHMSDSDLDILAANDVNISYNPVSNMKLCDGIMPYAKAKERGINITLGVDGAQSNNSLDMFSDVKTGVLLQKLHNGDPASMTAEEAVRMMTIRGAEAVGMSDMIGSIEVGKRADLISIDTDTPGFSPLYPTSVERAYSHIIYSDVAVNDVIVDGEFLLKDKVPTRIDRRKLIADLNQCSIELAERIRK